MAKHQKRFLDIFLDNSSGLSNAVEVVTTLLSMAFSDGFLRLKEVSAPDDLARKPFTCSLKAQTSIILLELSKSPMLGTN